MFGSVRNEIHIFGFHKTDLKFGFMIKKWSRKHACLSLIDLNYDGLRALSKPVYCIRYGIRWQDLSVPDFSVAQWFAFLIMDREVQGSDTNHPHG